MTQRVFSILLLALIIAAAASYLVYRMVQVRLGRNSSQPASAIVVAAHKLEMGTLVRDADLKMGQWTGSLPKDMATNPQAILGRGVVSPIYEGEPILETRLAPKEAGGGLAATIPPGMRACAVKVNEVVGVSGFAVPGMRVDVLISGTAPNAPANPGPKVRTILQNIEVLSAGQKMERDAEGKPVSTQVINLLVTPEQAEVLSLASNETRIQLVLRNPMDTQVAKVPGSAMTALFADQNGQVPVKSRPAVIKVKASAVPDAKRPAAEVFVIEVLNGPKKAEAKFPAEGETKQ